MAKDTRPEKPKGAAPEQYAEVVARLRGIVDALEAGELPLEASLERFAEGVQLVKRGEKLLSEAEKRIEQLLSEDGRTAPLSVDEGAANRPAKKSGPKGGEGDDVPF